MKLTLEQRTYVGMARPGSREKRGEKWHEHNKSKSKGKKEAGAEEKSQPDGCRRNITFLTFLSVCGFMEYPLSERDIATFFNNPFCMEVVLVIFKITNTTSIRTNLKNWLYLVVLD